MTSTRFLLSTVRQSPTPRGRFAVAALVILGVGCSSSTPQGGNGGSGSGSGGASGGAVTMNTGGVTGSGGVASGGTGGSGSGGNASGGAGGSGSGGSGSGGSGSGGSGSGGAGSGGATGTAGSGRGGSVTGGARTGGASSSAGASGGGATGTGGATGSGGAGGGSGSGTGGATSSGGTTVTGGSTGVSACPSLPGAPSGTAPLPSTAQLAYQRTEMTSFIHYGLATYDGQEQCSPSSSPSIFNPSKLDATTVGQWVSTLKGAGFRQSMLVTKHSCGFALWPSKYTDHSVAASPWMGGKGDLVQMWTDAMEANDMRVALYLSPWDSKYPSSSASYETYFKNQLTELFAYGPAHEVEFDGFNAPANVNWKSVFQFIKEAQPNILIWAGPEIVKTGAVPDLQWIGNENGQGSRTTSSIDTSNCGGGKTWCPWECNVSSHRPQWFWHPNPTVIALADMQSVYFRTVGMNCTLNFNVPPSQTGEFDPKDVTLLQQFGTWYASLYKTNLTKGQPATADSTWASEGFEAARAVDDDLCTYWAAASGKTSARLEVTLASPAAANLLSIREAIELGERVTKYHVELKQNGTWTAAPKDKSGTTIAGTVIGNRQLWQLAGANVEAVRLVIDTAKDVPAIAEFSVY